MKTVISSLLLIFLSGCGGSSNNLLNDANTTRLNTTKEVSTNTNLQNINAEALYAPCAACHGKNAEISALGKSQIVANFTKTEIIDAIKGYQTGNRDITGFGGLMKGQVAGLTSDDVTILADYIAFELQK